MTDKQEASFCYADYEIDMDSVQKEVDIEDILASVELIEKSLKNIAWHTEKIKKIAKRWQEERSK